MVESGTSSGGTEDRERQSAGRWRQVLVHNSRNQESITKSQEYKREVGDSKTGDECMTIRGVNAVVLMWE